MEQIIIERNVKRDRPNNVFDRLKPRLFEEDHMYCCLLGDDLRHGVKGFGHTAEEAIDDWETSLRKRIQHMPDTDFIIKDLLSTLKAGRT